VLAVVLEVQRGWDTGKRWIWKLYVAQLEAELAVNTALLVYCPDPGIARRYRGMFQFEGLSLALRPFILTPDDVPLVTEVELARAQPALAVFSAICHGDDPDLDAAFPALADALRAAGPAKAILYYDIVLAGLPPAPRTRWEAYMTIPVDHEFRTPWLREAEGEARAVLDARGVQVPETIREQILACTDLATLDTWLRHAVTAATAEDVIHG